MKCIKFIKMKIISLGTFFFKLLSKFTARTSQSILMESKDREKGRERERERERERKARKLSLHFVLETKHCCLLYRKCWNRKSLIRYMTYSNYSIRLRSVHKSCGKQDIIESFRRPCQAASLGYILSSLHADACFISLNQLK